MHKSGCQNSIIVPPTKNKIHTIATSRYSYQNRQRPKFHRKEQKGVKHFRGPLEGRGHEVYVFSNMLVLST